MYVCIYVFVSVREGKVVGDGDCSLQAVSAVSVQLRMNTLSCTQHLVKLILRMFI